MTININIQVSDEDTVRTTTGAPVGHAELATKLADLRAQHDELIAQMGDEIGPFPRAKIGGYMSHFQITLELTEGPKAGQIVSIVSPLAAQSVAWSDPFIYEGPAANHVVRTPIPVGCHLSDTISEADFINRPPEYFEPGKESLWLQILNLDANMETDIGPVRIILGETLKTEYPDIFKPSLGVAQSLGRNGGFPARLFFNPYAIMETPLGAFRAIHGTLAYGRVTSFPPIGTPVTICDCVPLEPVDDVRSMVKKGDDRLAKSIGRIVALSHPIDMEMQLPGEESFQFVSACIDHASDRAQSK